MTNYYQILEISESATPEEIKSAFKKQAVKYHPDKHPGDPSMEEKFKEINEAYQVLSDEYEKARYDLKLKYQQFSESAASTTAYEYNTVNRRYYSEPKVDHKQNNIATLYAFGITLGIALIVMSGVWIKQWHDSRKLEKRLHERRQTYEEARRLFQNEDYENALELMSTIRFFGLEEKDMKFFKDNMVEQIIQQGNQSLDDENYSKAIYLYELVQNFEQDKPLFLLRSHLAEAYRKADMPQKSIAVYQDLMMREYKIITSLIEIAKIHRDILNDPINAREYYLAAHKRAVTQYKRFYGEGYALVINEKHVPEDHYELYTGLANIYLDLEDPEMAIKAAKWNKYVWPDSTDAFITSANAYIMLREESNACQEIAKAKTRGWVGQFTLSCN